MYDNVEKRCVELFGDCPLNMSDFLGAKTFGYSEEDLIFEAARKFYLNEEHNFSVALCDWMNGKKLNISREEAQKRNQYVRKARDFLIMHDIYITTSINWESFPNDDPSICFYLGYPFDCELCKWAANYKKSA